MLSTQLQNAVIELLSQFIANDFSEIDKLKENYESAGQGECVVWDVESVGVWGGKWVFVMVSGCVGEGGS